MTTPKLPTTMGPSGWPVCKCPKSTHVHGTRNMYGYHRCRCRKCIKANSDYYHVATAPTLRLHEWSDADLARKRIAELREAGMPLNGIAKAIGKSPSYIGDLVRGTKSGTVQRVFTPTLEALNAISYRDIGNRPLTPRTRVDGTSTAAMLKALHSVGWSVHTLVPRLGIGQSAINKIMRVGRTTAANRDHIAALFPTLIDELPPAETPLDLTRIRSAILRADRNDWHAGVLFDDVAA